MKGLLVDFGGVLTTNVFDSFRAFCEREGLDPDTVKRLFREDPRALGELRKLERGEVSEEEFSERFGPIVGVSDTDGLVDRLFAGMEPDEAMIEAVRKARAGGVRTGLISNSWGTALKYEDDLMERLFDGLVISHLEGLRKPDPAIYALGAERIGLEPGRCVFLDDLPGNLKPARAMGMMT
ncbi:MAG: putative hydrolase of the superfamily, partial [Frankiales bacterium]|nr:putative hydrolase of the superfamily [Frankiales bacterium]